jgi:hypothetical protein
VTQTPWIATIEVATAGNNTIHDPGPNLKFNLMGISVSFPQALVSAGTSILDLQDGAVLISEIAQVKGTLAAMGFYEADYSPINGILSAADGNKLILNLVGSAFTTLAASLTAWGYDV